MENALTKAAEANIISKVECRYPSRGRMFEGFEAAPVDQTELSYCLCAARKEAAAVVAFERLAAELTEHGAPIELIAAAARSAEDERRHARLFAREARRIARALGVEAPSADLASPPRFASRSLLAMLEENAIEGCANETLAAIVATHQAEHAPSARLRALFAAIAADERDHALLAHRIHAWGIAQLDRAAADRLAERFQAACDAAAAWDATPLGARMGEPDPAVAGAALRHVVAGACGLTPGERAPHGSCAVACKPRSRRSHRSPAGSL